MSNAGTVIREERDEIIRLWFNEASRFLSAEGHTPAELISNIHDLLSSIALTSEDAPGTFAIAAEKQIASHVSSRLRQGFDIAYVVGELFLLGRCIVGAWSSSQHHAPPSAADVQRVNSQVSGACVVATEMFRAHMMTEEQTEKRMMRLMSAVAREALFNDQIVQERADELLALVLRAMNAQSAALRIQGVERDVERASLFVTSTSSAGVGKEALARFAFEDAPLSRLGPQPLPPAPTPTPALGIRTPTWPRAHPPSPAMTAMTTAANKVLATAGLPFTATPTSTFTFPSALAFATTATENAGAAASSPATLSPSAAPTEADASFGTEDSSSKRLRMDGSLATAVEMHVGEELWSNGVRSLLAVRTSRSAVVTTLYVGTSATHAFSSRELRRAEVLADWLTVLLDNALLHAKLADRVRSQTRAAELSDHLVSLVAHDLRGPLSAAKLCADLLVRSSAEGAFERAVGLSAMPLNDAGLPATSRTSATSTTSATSGALAEIAIPPHRGKNGTNGRHAANGGAARLVQDVELLAARLVTFLTRCEHLVTDFLDANRLHAGKPLQLVLGSCNLKEICESVVQDLHALIGDRALLVLTPVTGTWSGRELRRAVSNLVANAARHGERGSTITISARAVSTGAEISVHSIGPPIEPRDVELMLRPFARPTVAGRGASRSGPVSEGWGLGLALAKGCADAHGGTLSVASDRHGATFTMKIPLDARTAERENRNATPGSPQSGA